MWKALFKMFLNVCEIDIFGNSVRKSTERGAKELYLDSALHLTFVDVHLALYHPENISSRRGTFLTNIDKCYFHGTI